MNTIEVRTEELEQINEKIRLASSLLEDAVGMLRQTVDEMQMETAQFGTQQNWNLAGEVAQAALERLKKLSERMLMLKTALKDVPQEYQDLEYECQKRLEKITGKIRNLNISMAGAMSPEYPVGIAEAERDSNAKALERKLAGEVLAMEMANLSAISKEIEEEYPFEKVEPMPEMKIREASLNHDEEEDGV